MKIAQFLDNVVADWPDSNHDVRIYKLSEPYYWRMTENDTELEPANYFIAIAGWSYYDNDWFTLILPCDKEAKIKTFATYPELRIMGTRCIDSLLSVIGYKTVYEGIWSEVFDQ